MLYTVYIILVMLFMPIVCIIIDYVKNKRDYRLLQFIEVVGKWFIFWSLGMRSLTAGISQTFNPAFTAYLLQVDSLQFVVIRELGVANITIGLLGVISLFIITWRKPAAFCSGLFLASCTLIHIMRLSEGINFTETMALISDFWAVLVAIIYLFYSKGLGIPKKTSLPTTT